MYIYCSLTGAIILQATHTEYFIHILKYDNLVKNSQRTDTIKIQNKIIKEAKLKKKKIKPNEKKIFNLRKQHTKKKLKYFSHFSF